MRAAPGAVDGVTSRAAGVYRRQLQNIANMAAIIGGFAFSGLCISTTYTGWLADLGVVTRTIVVDLFYAARRSRSASACSRASCAPRSTCAGAAALALRGPEGSLKRAVDTMRKFQKHVNTMIALGIVCFHRTAMTYAWTMLSKLQTVVTVTGVLFTFLFGMASYVVVIWHELRIDQQEIVRGGRRAVGLRDGRVRGRLGSRPEASEDRRRRADGGGVDAAAAAAAAAGAPQIEPDDRRVLWRLRRIRRLHLRRPTVRGEQRRRRRRDGRCAGRDPPPPPKPQEQTLTDVRRARASALSSGQGARDGEPARAPPEPAATRRRFAPRSAPPSRLVALVVVVRGPVAARAPGPPARCSWWNSL